MGTMFTFGNCKDCGEYAKLNENNRCRVCVEEEFSQINTAQELVQLKPKITLEEIAHALDIEESRVMEWVRKGHVRCVVIEYDCPRCNTHVQNMLSCPKCGHQEFSVLGDGILSDCPDFSSRMVTVDRRKPARSFTNTYKNKLSA